MKKLEFLPPKIRYETTVKHDNDGEQDFLIKLSSSEESELKEIMNNLSITLNEKNQEDVDDLKVFIELAGISESRRIQNLKFKVGNDTNPERTVEEPEVIIITRRPKQLPNLENSYYVGPLARVKADITLTAGEATFSVWQADQLEGQWSQVPGAKETLSRSSGKTNTILPDSSFAANPPKYFLLKVSGRPDSVYTVTGNWEIS